MNFDVLTQDITLGEVKGSDALKFLTELGLSGEALIQAEANYFDKSVLALAKNVGIFTVGAEMVLYLEKDKETNLSTIVVRKQFEDKKASLSFDLGNERVVMEAVIDGALKTKEYKSDAKIADIIKAFNAFLKTMAK